MQNLIIIGAGYGFLDVIELVDDINSVNMRYRVVGILDDDERLWGKSVHNVPVVGGLKDANQFKDCKFAFCIGTKNTRKVRKDILRKTGIVKDQFVSLVHPTAKIYGSSKIGVGCIVLYGCVIYSKSVLGDFCLLSSNVVVSNDVVVGDYSMVGGGTVILNRVKIEEAAFIASGVTVNDDVIIGKHAVVGIGSVLLKNVGEDQFAFGNPARVMNSMEGIGR